MVRTHGLQRVRGRRWRSRNQLMDLWVRTMDQDQDGASRRGGGGRGRPRLNSQIIDGATGLSAYSDRVGTAKNRQCKQNVTVTGIFSIRRSFFGPNKCHSNRNVNVTGVTVSGEACIRNRLL